MSKRMVAKSVGSGKFKTGVYTGDGNATQAIIGVGFQPIFLIVYPQATANSMEARKCSLDGLSTMMIEYNTVGGVTQNRYETDQVISLDADGFTVGDGTGSVCVGDNLNTLARNYTYIAWG